MGGLKKRKALKRLKRRANAFDEHGEWTRNNPGKQDGAKWHVMHRPGSYRK